MAITLISYDMDLQLFICAWCWKVDVENLRDEIHSLHRSLSYRFCDKTYTISAINLSLDYYSSSLTSLFIPSTTSFSFHISLLFLVEVTEICLHFQVAWNIISLQFLTIQNNIFNWSNCKMCELNCKLGFTLKCVRMNRERGWQSSW